jgi:histidyl-tRNA synthetase
VGVAGVEAEVEIISLAHAIMKAFGAQDKDFVIKINDRAAMPDDRELLRKADKGEARIEVAESERVKQVLATLKLPNAVFDPNIVRGFDYYTGLVFEVFDTNGENQRSLFGGGRYDNLLEIFGVEPVPCVGFGMGDITIRDFLETHKLPLGIVPVSGRA